ncbi:MAG: nitroreductase/quinone reductase family protein [Chloroflexota bacterium]
MQFAEEDLARLAQADEVEIETRAASGEVHRTIIWIVVDGGEVFVRSVNGERGRWYREAVARPSVAIHVDGRRLAATARPAPDIDAVERTSLALERKYDNDPGTAPMLRPQVLATTLRLIPA